MSFPSSVTSALDLAILVHDLSATGVAGNAIRIAAGMAARGLSVELWVVRDGGAFRSRVPQNVAVRIIGSGTRLHIRRLEVLYAIPAIAREITTRQPRVILSAGNHFHWAAGPAYAKAGRPSGTRLMGRASNAPPVGHWPVFGHLARRWDAMKYKEMQTVIAVSHELAAMLTDELRLTPTKIVTIPNGVNIADLERQGTLPLDDPWYADGAPPVILGVGRLSRQKNFPLLIEAFALLRRERAARLLILGDGPVRTRESLLRLAAKLGVAADVRLAGFEPHPMRHFARAGMFVLSSLWEGASNVVLEAMACGCPVVAVDCPTGVKEQLGNGSVGPIVPQNDAPALARAMAERLAAPRNSEALRSQARQFDADKMLDAYALLIGAQVGPGDGRISESGEFGPSRASAGDV
ncbi:glycosyltransferase [Aestuariivirga sp.]|uniref:glycosyltransferase n=1 Tax=Aestuariivirga sp. TaxID=2650926 RepID=UPI0039E3A3D4